MTFAQNELVIAAEIALHHALAVLHEGDTKGAYESTYKAMDFLDAIQSLECFENIRQDEEDNDEFDCEYCTDSNKE